MKGLVYTTHSLRYGKVLGLNILGDVKVCSFDCGYCDLGPSTLTMNYIKKELSFPSLEKIREQLIKDLFPIPVVDAILLSGNGEPTLHPQFDEVVQMLMAVCKDNMPRTPVVGLSSGAHLDSKKVVTGLNLLDERVIKVDAGSDNIHKLINQPLVRTNLAKLISGIKKLRDFTVQSMFVQGSADNTSNEAIEDWIEVMGIMKPKAIQLTTISRKPSVSTLQAVNEDLLYSIAHRLKKRTQLEAHVYTGK